MAVAYLFPGQGVQSPDHQVAVRELAPDLLEIVIDALGEDPFPRCGESTRFAQPAIVLASLAAWRRTSGRDAAAFAGHSLGEVSALAASGAISQADAVQLAVSRGAAMADAAEQIPDGTMLAVIGGEAEQVHKLAAEHNLVVANDNAPDQQVLAGPRTDIDLARRAARKDGMRAVELNVAGAFHSPQMVSAQKALGDALQQPVWHQPVVPVYSGLTISPFTDPTVELAQAVTSPVRWRELILVLRDRGITSFVDVGPGRVLERLAEKILKEQHDGLVVA